MDIMKASGGYEFKPIIVDLHTDLGKITDVVDLANLPKVIGGSAVCTDRDGKEDKHCSTFEHPRLSAYLASLVRVEKGQPPPNVGSDKSAASRPAAPCELSPENFDTYFELQQTQSVSPVELQTQSLDDACTEGDIGDVELQHTQTMLG